jgi:hypothetical protein
MPPRLRLHAAKEASPQISQADCRFE